jgi:hypothetical protein
VGQSDLSDLSDLSDRSDLWVLTIRQSGLCLLEVLSLRSFLLQSRLLHLSVRSVLFLLSGLWLLLLNQLLQQNRLLQLCQHLLALADLSHRLDQYSLLDLSDLRLQQHQSHPGFRLQTQAM